MVLSNKLANFLQKSQSQEYIAKGEFSALYSSCTFKLRPELTDALYGAGVDPLVGMDTIPIICKDEDVRIPKARRGR